MGLSQVEICHSTQCSPLAIRTDTGWHSLATAGVTLALGTCFEFTKVGFYKNKTRPPRYCRYLQCTDS